MNRCKISNINQYLDKYLKIVALPDFQDAPQEDYSEYFWPSRDNSCCVGLAACCDTPKRIASHVPKEKRKVMVQAGGNAGYFVRKFADEFEIVYTFEPDPINFLCLSLNTLLTNNVQKFQACVGDSHQLVSIQNMWEDDIGGIHITPTDEIQHTHTTIPTIMIDDLNLNSCDLIQFDVEGYEYNALKGAEKTIEKFKPVICIEYYENGYTHETWNDRYGKNRIEEIEAFLSQWNYTLVDSFETDRVYKIV